MTHFIAHLRSAVAKRAEYNRIKFELANMPLDVALDLGMFREDAAKTAYRQVYGG